MTLLSIGRHSLIVGALGVVLTSQPTFAVLGQTPETLCPRSTAASNERNTSYEEFKARFGHRFKSEQETQFAWRVYQAVHNTSATVVLGRLNDVRPYLGKPGYCVLSDLRPYSIAINEVFLFGGIDRRARFLLVSESPHEIMNAGVDLNQAETDRQKYWRVIYNHELEVLRRTGQYDIPADFKPPHLLASSALPQGQLGTTWDVEEQNGWKATWTPNTSGEGHAAYFRGLEHFDAVVRVKIEGNHVTAGRWNSSSASGNPTCTYDGTVDEHGVVVGTYFCPSGMYNPAAWRVTIHGYRPSTTTRPAGSGAGFGPREDNTTFSGGTNIRFFGVNDIAQCEAACAADTQCKAYTFVKRGAYESNPNNAVCYLSSSFANRVHSSCCISAVK